MSEVAIEVRGLSKRYWIEHRSRHDTLRDRISHGFSRLQKGSAGLGTTSREEFWALRDVNFSVMRGEVMGIIGRNGAGKSTLLKLLSRITEPTEGRFEMKGRVASLLEVGTGFHPELSGRDNIYLNGAILGMPRTEIRRKFDEIVAFAEVERFLDTPVKHYSSGMYVRLAFAVAAHLEPDILIVDEVLAVGDLAFQKKCFGRMEAVSREEGRTVIFVSHNTEAIARLCTTALYLQDGKLCQRGPAGAVVAHYLTQGSNGAAYVRSESKKYGIVGVEVVPPRGADRTFTARISFASEREIREPVIGMVVSTLGGQPLFGTNSLMHPPSVLAKALRQGIAEVAVKDFPLWSGTYKASFFLSDGIHNTDSVLDAVMFDLVSDYLPASAPDPKDIGSIHVPAHWKIST